MGNKKLVDYGKFGYIFSIPFILAFLVFSLYPILYTFYIGFTDFAGMAATIKDSKVLWSEPFKNFISVFKSNLFRKSFGNTVVIWIMNFIPQMGLALLLTAWFTDRRSKVKGQGIFKILFYMPNIITAATVAVLFTQIFGYPSGPINTTLLKLGLTEKGINFVLTPWRIKGVVAFIQFWQWYGYTMVILISGVIGIDPAIFEAADLDGANRVQTFFLVTLPCIRTVMLYTLVTSLIGGLNMFDIPSLYARDQGDSGGYTVNMYIKDVAFTGKQRYNLAAAASIIMFIIIVALSLVLFYIMRDKDEAKLKKLKKQALKAAKAKKAY
ncbi:MAG: sugar ABC transporter permease [Clostridiales bacterium]|nr:sugar ABC transporter permease [Clostridiales bacterium]